MTDEAKQDLIADGLARVKDAAAFLGLSRSKVYELMDRGEIAYCRLGSSRRLPWRAIREYAASRVIARG